MWLEPVTGFLADEFFNMNGLGALYSRVSSYIFSDWNKCGEVMGLAPYGRANQFKSLVAFANGSLDVPEWTEAFDQPYLPEDENGAQPRHAALAGPRLARARRHRAGPDRARDLAARDDGRQESLHRRRRGAELRRQRQDRARGRLRQCWIQPAAGDDGIAIGCAYYGHLAIHNKPRSFVMEHAFLGAPYSDWD